MNTLRSFFILAALLLSAISANAATCFWIGGTGDFDNANTASWASTSGGTTGTCAATGGIPKNAADLATFDANSGGGTVTVCGASSANCPSAAGSLNITTVTMGAFTGTLDFAAIDPNITLVSFSGTGTGTRTLNMGDGTWTITGVANNVWECSTVTNFTLNANGSTINFASTPTTNRQFNFGAKTYNNISITNAAASSFSIDFASAGAWTVAGTFTLTNVRQVRLAASTTVVVTGALTYNGTASQQGTIYSSGLAATLSVGATNVLNWVLIQNITKAGAGSISAINSFDGGGNTGITITGPSSGRIIGG